MLTSITYPIAVSPSFADRIANAETVEASNQQDWSLLAGVANGSEEDFETLVRRYEARLLRLSYRLLHDPSEAEDVVQETFIRLFRKAGRFRPRGALFTLLYRMATNNCLNRLRRRRVVRFFSFSDSSSGEPLAIVDAAPGPERSLEAKHRLARARSILSKLPSSQAAVLVLVRIEGLSYKEAAQVLGTTVSAVESRLFRAARNLEAATARESGNASVRERDERK